MLLALVEVSREESTMGPSLLSIFEVEKAREITMDMAIHDIAFVFSLTGVPPAAATR